MKKWFLVFAVAAMAVGCKQTEYVTVEKVRTDTMYQVKVQRDSVFRHDSVFVREYAHHDTVFVETTRWRSLVQERWRVDTVYKSKVDSVMQALVREVPAELTKWQKLKMRAGEAAMGLVLLAFAVWVWRTK